MPSITSERSARRVTQAAAAETTSTGTASVMVPSILSAVRVCVFGVSQLLHRDGVGEDHGG